MAKPQRVEYRVSFYEPDSEKECADFDAATPFAPVHVGDRLVGAIWKESAYPEDPHDEYVEVAQVTRVVRSLSRVGDTIHDFTGVYCKRLKRE